MTDLSRLNSLTDIAALQAKRAAIDDRKAFMGALDGAIADGVADTAATILEKLSDRQIQMLARRYIEVSLRNDIEVMLANGACIHF